MVLNDASEESFASVEARLGEVQSERELRYLLESLLRQSRLQAFSVYLFDLDAEGAEGVVRVTRAPATQCAHAHPQRSRKQA